jgi:GNAT superfamily N-acetyltransferase
MASLRDVLARLSKQQEPRLLGPAGRSTSETCWPTSLEKVYHVASFMSTIIPGSAPMIRIGPLAPSERGVWQARLRASIDCDQRGEPPEMYDRAWGELQADTSLHAFGARLDSRLVGISHFRVHPNPSGPDGCALQDRLPAPDVGGQGIARALRSAVVDWARARGCGGVYWPPQAANSTARHLDDKVAENRGCIRYQIAPVAPGQAQGSGWGRDAKGSQPKSSPPRCVTCLGGQKPSRLEDGALAMPPLGSIRLRPGRLVGNQQGIWRAPGWSVRASCSPL